MHAPCMPPMYALNYPLAGSTHRGGDSRRGETYSNLPFAPWVSCRTTYRAMVKYSRVPGAGATLELTNGKCYSSLPHLFATFSPSERFSSTRIERVSDALEAFVSFSGITILSHWSKRTAWIICRRIAYHHRGGTIARGSRTSRNSRRLDDLLSRPDAREWLWKVRRSARLFSLLSCGFLSDLSEPPRGCEDR